tara:strand:- start:3 stop:647 length:645 start_codon:yes stop_codon:yes gene_type:complete
MEEIKTKPSKYIKKEKPKYYDILKNKLGDFDNYADVGRYLDKLNTKMNNYLKISKLDNFEWPEYSHNCMCSHWIIKQCYIQNIITREILVVGDCCIKHFKIKKKCIGCNKNHGRTKYNICNDCEKNKKKELKLSKFTQKIESEKKIEQQKKIYKYDNKILKFSKHKFKTYKYIYDNHLDFIEWCEKKYLEYQKETIGSSSLFDDIVYYYRLKRE